MTTFAVAAPAVTRSRAATRTAPRRLVELDVLRGLAIVGMLLVNNPGDRATTPWPLRHTEWAGLSPADLVFPVFLVAVGMSMPFSRRADAPRCVARRVALLWLLGAALQSVKTGGLTLNGGVLQHIAGAFLVAWLVLRLPRHGQVTAAAGLVTLTSAALLGGSWAGVLAVSMGAINVLAGAWIGEVVRDGARDRHLVAFAVAGIAGGLLLAVAGVPVVKRLWSPSYAVLTAGLALALLVGVRATLRVGGIGWTAHRLDELGRNPIAIYVVAHFLAYTVLDAVRRPAVDALAPAVGGMGAGIAYSLAIVAGAVALARWLDRRGIVVRV